MRQPTVLIANDQEWTGRSLESVLVPLGFFVSRAFTGRQALERAREASPDLIILDAQLPDLHGFDVCRVLRADPQFGRLTPILITTAGPAGRAERLEALGAGAWEFFAQPIDQDLLIIKVQNFVAAKREAESLRDSALLDEDTGVYNTRGLMKRAAELCGETHRRRAPLTCAVFVPTSPGRAPASLSPEERKELGERLGQLLNKVGRNSDVVGRTGDAEFTLLAPATSGQAALRMVNRLRHAVEAQPASGLRLSFAAGLAEAPNNGAMPISPDVLVQRAAETAGELGSLADAGAAGAIRIFSPS